MKKHLFFTAIFLLFFYTTALAAGFNLKSINGVSTDGTWSSQWYHTDLQPSLSGDASAGKEVKITVDDNAYTTTADESGNWSWTPPEALSSGDHSVVLASSGGEIKFSLTLGKENIDSSKIGKAGKKMPTVGVATPTMLLLGIGILFLLLPQIKKLFLK